jgi:glycosyltransferase involved in cell wall biosynthesis
VLFRPWTSSAIHHVRYPLPVALRIAFDGRAFSSPAGGVRRYVSELATAIGRVDPAIALVAIGAAESTALPSNVERVRTGWSAPTNLGWAATGLPMAARRTAFDVFHAPAYTAPLWGVTPIVVTIHDVSYARRPAWYPHGSGAFRRAFYRASARRATRVVTDSAFSRDEIVAAYQIPSDRIDIVPLAASAMFTPDAAAPREPIVLHVGDLHPRRNVILLLDVVIDLRRTEAACRDLRLVLVGVDRGSLAELERRAREAGASDALEYAGRPGDVELRAWYRRAGVFAYPSRYEGFGLPVLEAMACGAPVVGSSAASVPEVVGRAGECLDPDDLRGWREAIAALVSNKERAREASVRSLARAAMFSWDRTARETLAVYARVRASR